MNEEDYLAHFGVKGMKWGVRRYQNKDGTLTNAGKKRYADDSAKSTTKQTKKDKYFSDFKTLGYDDEAAKRAAEGRARTEKALMVLGGVAAASAVAYIAYKYYDGHADRFIKPTKALQTVHLGDISERVKPGNPFYATYTKADNKIYASKVFSHFTDQSSVSKFYTKDGIKVASEHSGRKVFESLLNSDDEFKKYISTTIAATNPKDRYRYFNRHLVIRGGEAEKAHEKFYNALKKRGYGAVMDMEDSKIESFTWNPVIVFDDQMKNVVSTIKATPEQLGAKRMKEGLRYAKARQIINDPESLISIGSNYAASLGLVAYGINSGFKEVDNKVKFVNEYKKQHPNTVLTRKQIEEMYAKKLRGG